MKQWKQNGWRVDAVELVEGLFGQARKEHWDILLDLRQELIAGKDWAKVLEVFFTCRQRIEVDCYLPMYRLRRLLAVSLRLEVEDSGVAIAPMERLLLEKHRSLRALQRRLQREWFEHGAGDSEPLSLRVVESSQGMMSAS